MEEAVNLDVLRVVTVVASLIVLLGWLAAAALGGVLVSRRVSALRTQAGGTLPSPDTMALLLYLLSVLFWPAGFVLGLYFLRAPETALQGRNCLYIGIGYITVITALTCLGMAVLGVTMPELLAPLVR